MSIYITDPHIICLGSEVPDRAREGVGSAVQQQVLKSREKMLAEMKKKAHLPYCGTQVNTVIAKVMPHGVQAMGSTEPYLDQSRSCQ